MTFPSSETEADRLASLYRLNVLDTKRESAFDRIAEAAQQTFGVEGPAVSLVCKERQTAVVQGHLRTQPRTNLR